MPRIFFAIGLNMIVPLAFLVLAPFMLGFDPATRQYIGTDIVYLNCLEGYVPGLKCEDVGRLNALWPIALFSLLFGILLPILAATLPIGRPGKKGMVGLVRIIVIAGAVLLFITTLVLAGGLVIFTLGRATMAGWITLMQVALLVAIAFYGLVGMARVGYAIFNASRAPEPDMMRAVVLDRADAPALMATVERAFAKAGQAMPDTVILGARGELGTTHHPLIITPAMQEVSGLTLFIGDPLVNMMDEAELEALLVVAASHARQYNTKPDADLLWAEVWYHRFLVPIVRSDLHYLGGWILTLAVLEARMIEAASEILRTHAQIANEEAVKSASVKTVGRALAGELLFHELTLRAASEASKALSQGHKVDRFAALRATWSIDPPDMSKIGDTAIDDLPRFVDLGINPRQSMPSAPDLEWQPTTQTHYSERLEAQLQAGFESLAGSLARYGKPDPKDKKVEKTRATMAAIYTHLLNTVKPETLDTYRKLEKAAQSRHKDFSRLQFRKAWLEWMKGGRKGAKAADLSGLDGRDQKALEAMLKAASAR